MLGQVRTEPLPVSTVKLRPGASTSTWNRAPLAMIRARLTAAASTIVLSTLSFIVGPQRQVLLLGERGPVLLAVLAAQDLEQVGNRAVVAEGSDPQGLAPRIQLLSKSGQSDSSA